MQTLSFPTAQQGNTYCQNLKSLHISDNEKDTAHRVQNFVL